MIRKNVVIFISGEGSNMLSLINETELPDYPAKIVAVFSDNIHARGLMKAREKNIPTYIFPRENNVSQKEHEEKILKELSNIKPDFICLAGYMRVLSSHFISHYKDRILNIHPSLLPLFPGLHTHRRALEAGVKITGCTVHIVTEAIDNGPILAQAAVPVFPDDTQENLASRVLFVEHRLYPLTLKYIADEKRVIYERKNLGYLLSIN
ncbi:Phosphoribosylglycinamide formyltransferase [Liberibacter crescens BT-1]|uniref:Phosphoribosylglycinamide formyltransferase n=1 Tax=Liberibacter crescens (strain BT-1) TaxID=1215343 RepID=L0EXH2_LIBCB|nr:phosphoribosylglycinamide formyltransferase [Liberibacter crescens]AGA65066.1 Phosphoribosylglycinamide formyltransferase [Liberibacter crescens BT-1]AMC13058.1 phosphoribosylglycinamide formyltransferase [Liberibacter crescens]